MGIFPRVICLRMIGIVVYRGQSTRVPPGILEFKKVKSLCFRVPKFQLKWNSLMSFVNVKIFSLAVPENNVKLLLRR
jgi:hypothetical protein